MYGGIQKMTSKLAKVKNSVLVLLSDGREHSSDEIKALIQEEGIELDRNSSTLRTAIYQLRNSGIDIYSRERGVYQIKEKEKERDSPFLKDFTTLMPEKKVSPKCIYVHGDGSLVLNGSLNAEIKTRQVEIKVSNDGKKLALIPDGENNHKFTKSGRTQNMELVKKLKSKRINVPTTFEMAQNKDSGIWIGEIHRNEKSKKTK